MAVRGIGTLYFNDKPIGIATDFNLNINNTYGSMRSKYNRPTTLIGNVADFKLNPKKESKMSKSRKNKNKSRKSYIKMLEKTVSEERAISEVQLTKSRNLFEMMGERNNELATMQSQMVNLKERLHHQHCEIVRLNSNADKNLKEFQRMNDSYQKAVDFIGSITKDMKVNVDIIP